MRLLLAGIVSAIATTAGAQQQCGPANMVIGSLSQQWGESLAVQGIAADGTPLQWWLNPETGSWTIIALLPDGLACVAASGGNGERIAARPAGAPA